MQVDNNSQYKSIQDSQLDSQNSPKQDNLPSDGKQIRAENRIARYEQKPQRKASKMLVRLLQWADKLVMKFFTKKLLPQALQIFFDRQARANKVQLKKAQIDYSVQDFAVRLYVFWVCQFYFDKSQYQNNLDKLLKELCDELIRKKNNLAQSLLSCQDETERKQKEQELKWMQAIIKGLKDFINSYTGLCSQNEILKFLQTITQDIMVECLRKPGNKLIKKKQKLQVKIKYFQEKIANILGNRQITSVPQIKEVKQSKLFVKSNIIIQSNNNPFGGLTRSISNSSAFRKYTGQIQIVKSEQLVKRQSFQIKFQTPNKFLNFQRQQNFNLSEIKLSPQNIDIQKAEKTKIESEINISNEVKMQQEQNLSE